MPENKNFVERIVQDGEAPNPAYETLKFNDLKNADGGNGDWLSHIILGYIPKDLFEQMCEAPNWTPEAMQVAITINGITVIHTQFEAMISEFSGRMLDQRMHNGDWHNFEKAVATKAQKILNTALNGFTELADGLQNNLRQIADQSDVLVETIYNQPYKWQITSEMKDAGAQAIGDFGDHNDTPINRRILADKVYSAMVKLKPEGVGANVKLKLPPAIPKAPADLLGPSIDKRELKGRQDMLQEMKVALLEIGIDVSKLV